jgi:CRISPR-associated helicase Cas3/CRISPR-associated endonuclease Cas3-HD
VSDDDVTWSAAALSVWGKSSGYDGEQWMPLAQHLIDSADVAGLVWDWLPLHVRNLIDDALPAGARNGRALVRWLAGVHDIGKCSPPFASKMPVLAERMREHGFIFPRDTTDFAKAPHGLVGQVVLSRWLQESHGFGRAAATSYAVVIGGHHGTPPSVLNLRAAHRNPDLTGEGTWAVVQAEILDRMTARVGAADLLTAWSHAPLPPTVQAVLTGAVIVSDWLASNTELFPYGSEDQAARVSEAWRGLGLPAPWRPSRPPTDAAEHLAARFPHLAGLRSRPVQQLALDAAQAAESPSLMIVEAAMGTGKTEAALLAAEVLAARFGCGGVYVALPTMATSDAMFGRVQDWIENLAGSGPTSTYLAHGKAGLNDRFNLVRQRRAASVWDEDASPQKVEAQVLSWLTGRKKGVLANMVVGTIDQLLFSALQAKHLALRHLAFAGKVVVVDEAHAADDYMRMYLTRSLEWLAAYGVPVVLLSATLPWSQRQELADAYRRGLGRSPVAITADAPYPGLTTVSAAGVTVASPSAEREASRLIEVRCLDDDLDTLAATLEGLLIEGGCAAVIRNTVGRAQETARYLRDRLADVEIVLHHSRFVATHRARKEAALREQLGPDGSKRAARQIVVGTQVLEQSLDVDFDVMVTDVAPVDLVLQRAGRLHRHERGSDEAGRPPALRTPRLFVTGIAAWRQDGLPEPDRGSRAVYGLSRLLRAAAVLDLDPVEPRSLRLPADIRSLVERAYAEAIPGPEGWREAIAEADRDHCRKVGEQRRRADDFRIAALDQLEDDNLVGWLEYGGASEADDARSPGASRVRDSEDGIEVIVVQRRADGTVVCLDVPGGEHAGELAVPLFGPPDDTIARALAATTVQLPQSMLNGSDFDTTLQALEADAHEGWQESHWLAGQLALHLDDDWTAQVGDWQVSYDIDLGLMARRSP